MSRLHDGVMGGDGDGQIAQCLGDMLLMNMTEVDRVTHPTKPKIKAVCLSNQLWETERKGSGLTGSQRFIKKESLQGKLVAHMHNLTSCDYVQGNHTSTAISNPYSPGSPSVAMTATSDSCIVPQENPVHGTCALAAMVTGHMSDGIALHCELICTHTHQTKTFPL